MGPGHLFEWALSKLNPLNDTGVGVNKYPRSVDKLSLLHIFVHFLLKGCYVKAKLIMERLPFIILNKK